MDSLYNTGIIVYSGIIGLKRYGRLQNPTAIVIEEVVEINDCK